MFRVRFHGRGGHGIKTASRILGTAFFLSGYEVQDAPVYGAERRGAPIFAYVRADQTPIHERGLILNPDIVAVVDDTLVGVPAARVLAGLEERTVLLIHTRESAATWQHRLNFAGTILTLPVDAGMDAAEHQHASVAAAGAAARLCGVINREVLEEAVRTELAGFSSEEITKNVESAYVAFDAMAPHQSIVQGDHVAVPDPADEPGWIDVPTDSADVAAPAIHAALTSVQVRTGLWRTMRPVIDVDHCRGCWWVCSTFCPDDAITVSAASLPVIDYEHCKGCMICVAQCPPHAIVAIPEAEAAEKETTS